LPPNNPRKPTAATSLSRSSALWEEAVSYRVGGGTRNVRGRQGRAKKWRGSRGRGVGGMMHDGTGGESDASSLGVQARAREVFLGQGRVGGLAHGAVVGQDGASVILATVVSDRGMSGGDDVDGGAGGGDGCPFTVEYRERAHASGRIPRTPDRRERGALASWSHK
jgi:hypothetical protein